MCFVAREFIQTAGKFSGLLNSPRSQSRLQSPKCKVQSSLNKHDMQLVAKHSGAACSSSGRCTLPKAQLRWSLT